MGEVISAKFGAQRWHRQYSADIYSFDMHKFQFEQISTTLQEAYSDFVDQATGYGIQYIQCVAIYGGALNERGRGQPPVEVWLHRTACNGLVEV